MALCPPGCLHCCDTYTVTVGGGDHDGNIYAMTRTGCVWEDSTTYPGFVATLNCNSSTGQWVITMTVSGCTEVWAISIDDTDCPIVGFDYVNTSSDCSPASFIEVNNTDCPSPSGPTIGGNLLIAGF